MDSIDMNFSNILDLDYKVSISNIASLQND